MKKRNLHSKERFTIVVEGKTEAIYFEALKQLLPFRQSNYILVVENAKNLNDLIKASESGKIGRVFDKDHLTKEQLGRILKSGYSIGYSNPNFELWLLAHFIELRSAHSNINKELNSHMKDYKKGGPDITKLATDFNKAIENASKRNSPDFNKIGTSVGTLIANILVS